MQILNVADFKNIPWKNGQGTTCEMLKYSDENDIFYFRVSRAQVTSDGPFSIFPNITRHLFLLEGKGFVLHFQDSIKELSSRGDKAIFAGEEAIICTLINGACSDFNIMYDQTKLSLETKFLQDGFKLKQLIKEDEEYIIYDINKSELIILNSTDLAYSCTCESILIKLKFFT